MSGIDIDRIVEEAVEKSPYIPCLSVKNPFAAARRAAEMARDAERERTRKVLDSICAVSHTERAVMDEVRALLAATPEEAPEPRPKWWKCPKCGKERTGCDGNCKGAPDA